MKTTQKKDLLHRYLELLVIALVAAVLAFFQEPARGPSTMLTAEAAACPITDGGVGDDDATANGTITISTAKTFAAITGSYDCTATPVVITSSGVLTLDGNNATGQIAQVNFGTLTVDSGGVINANAKGCANLQPYYGYVPNGSNVCIYSGTGYAPYGNTTNTGGGGGGHGGYGGPGTASVEPGKVGGTNDSATAPVLFGASGGSANGVTGTGGTGGGVIRIIVSGTFTHNGTLTANGAAGAFVSGGAAGGGGAGGSINVVAGTLNGTTGTFSAVGGNGADNTGDGGGGGGGRVAVQTGGGSFGFSAIKFDVSGGSVTGNAVAGAKGTVYVKNTATNAVTIYHGFTYDNTGHFASSWTIDASATNQYCDTTITGSPAVHTTGAISFAGTLVCAPGAAGTGNYIQASGTISSSGSTVTGSGTNFPAQFGIGDPILANGQTRFVTAIISATSLTVDGTFSPDLSSGTSFWYSTSSVSSLTFDAATNFTVANGSSIKTKSAMFLTAGSSFSLGTGVFLSTSKVNADMEFNVPAGSSQTWDSLTVNVGPEGELITDDAFTLTLQNGTQLNGGVRLSALTTLTQNAGTSINANARGCVNQQPYYGYVPNGSNACIYNATGYAPYGNTSNTGGGGGGHGGYGGPGTASVEPGKVGGTNDSATAPVLFGASGGSANNVAWTGGNGGGVIRISVTGTFTHNGTLSANGAAGAIVSGGAAGGGGAGGSIFVSAGTLNGSTGTFSTAGGDGADNTGDGGGGGGGRVAVQTGGGSFSFDAGDFTVAGGSATGVAVAGAKGTVYVKNTATNAVTIYHGFSYDNTNHFASSWTIDPSATNQYCDTTLSSSAVPAVHTTGAISFAGTLVCAPGAAGNGTYTAGQGTISSAGTVVTGSGSNFSGQFSVGDAIIANGQTRFVTSIASTTSMTVDTAFSPDLSSGTVFWYSTNSVSSITFDAATNLTVANGSSIKTKSAMLLAAGSSFSLGTGVVLSTSKVNADIEFNVAAGSSQTWDSLTVNIGTEGEFITDDAFPLTLQNGTTINGSVRWTALTSLTQNAGTSINANARGCVNQQPYYGYVPDSANNCIYNGVGYAPYGNTTNTGGGGGGHGGYGGPGTASTEPGKVGGTNDSARFPVLFGASGGSANNVAGTGGAGGGVIRISVSGTFTHNGTLSANGANGVVVAGGAAGGGGAGGSINVTAGTLNGTTGTFSAAGGNGADNTGDGGGGGGGRVAVQTGGGSFSFDAGDFAVAGGSATGNAVAGAKGTVYVKNTATNAVTIYHGFTYDNTSHFAASWTIDPSATNQYCDTTITGSPAVHTTGAISFAGTLVCAPGAAGNGTYTAGQGTISSSGTAVTGSSSNFSGQFSVGDAIIANGQTRFVTSIASTTSMTVDMAFSPDLSSGTSFWYSTSAASSLSFDAATNLTIANGSSIKTKSAMLLAAGSSFSLGTGVVLSTHTVNADMEFNVPAGSSQTWDSLTVNIGREGEFITDDAFPLTLQNGTTINGSVRWTALTSLIQNSGTIINADARGCANLQPYYGYVPNSSNNCIYNDTGAAGYGASGNTGGAGGGHGGAGGLGTSTTGSAGGTNDSATAPILFGASGGSANGVAGTGGTGGGYIRISVSGTFTHNGTMTANGGNGAVVTGGAAGGGGAGGSVYVTAATYTCSTGIFSAKGGNGADNTGDGGGGGGGRLSVEYGTDSSGACPLSGLSAATAATGGTATGSAVAGGNGTLNLTNPVPTPGACPWVDNDVNDNDATVGTYEYAVSGSPYTVAASTTTYDCSNISLFKVVSGVTLNLNSNTSTGAVAAIKYNGLTIDSGGTISADGRGCPSQADYSRYPDGSNVCNVDVSTYSVGAGGAGHGGYGGTGSVNEGGAIGYTYGSATAPYQFGGSGAGRSSAPAGAAGGGVAKLTVTGTLTLNGTISANGNNGATSGNNSAGGGAGGTINIRAGAINGSTGLLRAKGGSGGDSVNDGGGGGGGRIAVTYNATGSSYAFSSSNLDVSGGTAASGGIAGTKGTVYVNDDNGTTSTTVDDDVTIFHGFTYADTDHFVSTWTADASTTNQYCDLGMGTGGTPSVSATTISEAGTVICANGLTTLATGTISSSGTTVTGSSTNFYQFGVGDLIYAAGQTRFVTAIASTASLTVDEAFSPALPSGTVFRYVTTSLSSLSFTASGGFSLAGSSSIKTKGAMSLSAGTSFSIGSGSMIAVTKVNADLDFNVPAGNDQTWSGLTVNMPPEGDFTVDDAVGITLSSGSALNGSIRFTNLTSFTENSGTSINASGRGCYGSTNYGMMPNGSNSCGTTIDIYGVGAGGASHGGLAGAGTSQAGSIGGTYDSSTAPFLYGAAGGGTNAGVIDSGFGGGLVRISATGAVVLNGSLSANGLDGKVNGTAAGGGGAGGSIYVSTSGALSGSIASFSAKGGNGADSTNDGGGGGGGRVAIAYGSTTMTPSSSLFDVAGGTATGSAVAGTKGTVYVDDAANTLNSAGDDVVRIYHGFTYTDADLTVAQWIIDPSATNQYCDTSMGTGATPSVSATSAITFDGALHCTTATSAGSGTITSSGVTVTGSGTSFISQLSFGSAILAGGQTRFVTSIASNTSLTVDSPFSPALSGAIYTINNNAIANFTWSSGTAFSTAASAVFRGNGAFFASAPSLTIGNSSVLVAKGSIGLSATSSFSMGSGVSITDVSVNADIDFNVPAGNDQTWSGLTVNGAPEGDLTVDDAVSITLSSGTALNASVRFTNLGTFTQNTGTSINAGSKGCAGTQNYGMMPNASNSCVTTIDIYGVGSGGGGHAGLGGAGTTQAGFIGPTYGSATAPVLYGAGGGGTNVGQTNGTNGGGVVRINASGAVVLNGSVTADGMAGSVYGTSATGGGAGGSVYVSTYGSLTGSIAAITAKGGNGAVSTQKGGGGGGGRIALVYGTTTLPLATGFFDVSGGTATSTAYAGQSGTVYTDKLGSNVFALNDDDVHVYTGFTYTDFDWTVNSWTVEPGAVQGCDPAMGTGATPSVTATGAISLDGSLSCTTTTTNGSGTISSSGTTVTGSGTSFLGQIVVGYAIIAGGQTRYVTAVASNTSLTIDAPFSPALASAPFIYNYNAIAGFAWQAGTTLSYAAGSAFKVNGPVSSTASTLSIGNSAMLLSRGATSLSASTSFSLGTGVVVTDLANNTDIDFNIPTSNDQNWSGFTVNVPPEGDLTVDDAVALTFSSGTTVNGNVRFTGLTAFTLNTGTSINANAKGCLGTANYGMVPGASNICNNLNGTYGVGAAGGGHGGNAGQGTNVQGGGIGYTFDSATAPALYGSSGGATNTGTNVGANGGGLVRISAAGTITLDGTVTANGADGTVQSTDAAGGAAGGSIYITTPGSLTGSIAAFSAKGGNGAVSTQKGGGGGGGRIALVYGTTTYSLAAGFFDVGGGTATAGAVAGTKGTVYVDDTANTSGTMADDIIRIFHGFTFADTDHNVAQWVIDASATNQYCDITLGTGATPSVTTSNPVTFKGAMNCDQASNIGSFTWTPTGGITFDPSTSMIVRGPLIFNPPTGSVSIGASATVSSNIGASTGGSLTITSPGSVTIGNGALLKSYGTMFVSAATSMSIGTGVTVTDDLLNTDIDFNIPAGNDQAWSGLTVNTPSEGDLTVDDAIAVTLSSGTAVNGNARFTNLTSFTQDNGTSINANGKGCVGNPAYGIGPNGSNVCGNLYATYGPGAGGGGNGGVGGNGSNNQGGGLGVTYGSATVPVLYGTSGGGGNSVPVGVSGGGLIRINASGTVTLNGTLSANGVNGGTSGANGGGGGSGGSIFVSAGTLAGTPAATWSAKGGNGGDSTNDGGGGGGGRMAFLYASSSMGLTASSFDVGGGTATGSAFAGTKGTVYVNNSTANTVQIFHGFTYPDTDFSVSSWTIDPGATNQYCDTAMGGGATPSVTSAGAITFYNTLSCPGAITSFAWSSPGGFTLSASGGMSVNGPLSVATTAALSLGNATSLTSNGNLNLSAVTGFSVGTGVTVTDNLLNTDIDFNIPAGADQTWDGLTVNVSNEGDFRMDDVVSLTLTNGATINGNVRWTNLTNFTQDSGTTINANGKGCTGGGAYSIGPDGSNTCNVLNSTYGAGAGGGGHGGTGGNGTTATGSGTYDSAAAPVLYGTSGGGGNSSPIGPNAGGLVRINASGTFTHNGVISADGNNGGISGGNAAGGASGGSIYLSTTTYTCSTGTFSADGGSGGNSTQKGGGGGGGRVAVSYNTDSSGGCPLSGLTAAGVAAGGSATSTATAGATGTLSLNAGNPVPAISNLSPSSRAVGSGAFTLTVNGSNFVAGSVVRWNGSDRTTTFVNANQVTASIPSSDQTAAGSFPVTVFNPAPAGGLSNAVNFDVTNPAPTTTSISPDNKNVGDTTFTMTVNGTNFVAGSVVRLDGSNRTTTYVNDTQLTASIPTSDMATGGSYSITVFNAGPGGGTSNGQTFTVGNPVPATSNISPTTKNQGDAGFTLTVNGSNFVSTSVVRFAGSDRVTTYVNANQLTAAIPAADMNVGGTFAITVFNPSPGGGTSNSQTFTVGNPVPTTSSISPSSKTTGDGSFTLTVNGTNFVSNSVVRLNGADRTTTFVNANQVTAAIPSSDNNVGGTFTITVFNTTPGGGTSNGQTFTVNNPTPAISNLSPSTRTANSGGFTLTVNGLNFVSNSVVRWNGSDRTTTFVNAGQVTASIPNSDIVTAGDVPVTVFNPSPAGGVSAPSTFSVSNPVPAISTISPTHVDPGSSTFTLTVNGTNFIASSMVRWNGSDRTTTFVNDTQLTASIPSSDVTTAGTFPITVFSPGAGTSNSKDFIVGNPVPATTSISPDNKTVGDAGFTLTVNGSEFIPSSVVRFNGADRTTTFVNANQVTASIPPSDLTAAGTFTITVFNPTPVGGTSNGQTFTVNNPVPTTTSVSPANKNVGDTTFTMTVNGTNFIASSVVRLDGNARTTTFVNSTQLTATIPTSDMTTAATHTITVFTSSPGGGVSNGQSFMVGNLAPTTVSLAPSHKAAGSATFTLTVNGNNFISGSVVRWNGSDRATTFIAATQVTATIPASDLTTPGSFPVAVFNPGPGGGVSNAEFFTVTVGENNPTLNNKITLSRLKAGASATVSIDFSLQDTLSGTLTVTFPVGFTVTSAATPGASSGCLSSFNFTSSTLTATKSGCSGPMTLGGATVTNPSTPGAYLITWVNDDPGGGSVIIVDSDQVSVSSSVDPSISFNVGSQASATACDGAFSGNGGTVGFGALDTASVASSDVSSVPHICTRVSTNAGAGAIVTVVSQNASLKSVSTPADTIPSSTATLVAGTTGYGLCAGSGGGDSGKDTTTPAGATPTGTSPFNGSCSTSTHAVGALTTSPQTVWSIAGPSQNAFHRLFLKAAIAPSVPAHDDYVDVITFIATGTY